MHFLLFFRKSDSEDSPSSDSESDQVDRSSEPKIEYISEFSNNTTLETSSTCFAPSSSDDMKEMGSKPHHIPPKPKPTSSQPVTPVKESPAERLKRLMREQLDRKSLLSSLS
jgi:hypothetical protein